MPDTKNKDLIKQLGGPAAVAEARKVTLRAARSWMYRGIPWRHRPAIAQLAKANGIKLPPDFLGA